MSRANKLVVRENGRSVTYSIRQNRYGNWYGYRGSKMVEMFLGDGIRSFDVAQEEVAKKWLDDKAFGKPPESEKRKPQETVADFKERIREMMPKREKSPIVREAGQHGHYPPPPMNAKQAERSAVKEYVRAGDQLGARYGVEIKKKFDGLNDVLFFLGAPVAYSKSPEDFVIFGQTIPKRAARALGHFLINAARENR